jgi:DNA helicase-2/ATP-dependent DNA helicase PcrA
MTELDQHPETTPEDQHLRRTLDTLEQRIEEIGTWEVMGYTTLDTVALQRHMVKVYKDLVTARKQVYFGRLDVMPAGKNEPESHYIGRIGFEQRGRIVVVDWRAPLARLFSRRRPGRAQYDSPDGRLTVDLQLKRQFKIQQETLREIFDEYDSRPTSLASGATRAGLVDPDAYLREIISGRRDAFMQDIVATIQEQQDELIRADPKQVLVIQGVAGSGKTAMALHRVAYLLYPGNQLGIDPERCIVFGPNQLFLGYIANVLPGLGVADIPQTTLDTWALDRLGLTGRPTVDPTLDALLDAGRRASDKRRRMQAAQLKGSRRMGQVLDRLAEWWRGRLTLPAAGLAFEDLGPFKVTARASKARVAELQQSLRELPVMRQRQRLAELLLSDLTGAYADAFEREAAELIETGEELRDRRQPLLDQAARLDEYSAYAAREDDIDLEQRDAPAGLKRGADGLRALAEYFERKGQATILRTTRIREEGRGNKQKTIVREALRQALESSLDSIWPALNPLRAYTQLLSDPQLLARLGRGVLGDDEIELLGQSAPPADGALDVSDLPALAYLHTTSEGLAAALYDHVVVDEAQDVAPLYYTLLRRFSRSGSLTILGDMAQGVYAHRGIGSWDEVRAAFDGLPYRFGVVRESYRSTHEIVSFANRLLELMAPAGQKPMLAEPFNRHGRPVTVHKLDQPDDLVPALAASIAALRSAEYQNIAVIAKTPDQCAQLAEALAAAGTAGVQLATGAGEPYPGGLLILPVHLAKGMEFEAVLVAGADEANYPSAEFEGRLLYVAATRALHALEIYPVGAPSALIELAAG